MTNRLQFGDHAVFHRHVMRMAIAGAGLGLASYLLSRIFSTEQIFAPAGPFSPDVILAPGNSTAVVVWMTIVATAIGLAVKPLTRARFLATLLFATGVSLLGALVTRVLVNSPPVYPWFGVAVWGMAVGTIAGRDLRDYRRFTLPLATGASVLLATWVLKTYMLKIPVTEYVPALVAAPLVGGLFGFLVSIGMVARQIQLEDDAVTREYRRVKPLLGGEIAELSERAMSTYSRIIDVLRDREDRGTPSDPELVRTVQAMVLRTLDLGNKWHEVEKEANQTTAKTLQDRVTELDAKISSANDGVARRQYQLAKDALAAQLRHLQDISRSRERVVARVHNHLATLERLHLAVLNHRGADAAEFSAGLAPMLEEIENIGEEMDFVSRGISETQEVTDAEPESAEPESAEPESASAESESASAESESAENESASAESESASAESESASAESESASAESESAENAEKSLIARSLS